MADRILATFEYTNKLAVVVDVGLYSDDQIFSDVVGVSESIDILQTRGLSDSVNVTDDLNGAAEGDDQTLFSTKDRSEAPAVTDVFSRTVDYVRYFGPNSLDYLTPEIEAQLDQEFDGWRADGSPERDALQDKPRLDEFYATVLSKPFSDTAQISESIFIQRVQALTDSVGVSESYAGDLTLVKADSSLVAESYVASYNAVYADTANISEEEELTPSKGPSDSSGVSEQYVATLTKVLSDTETVSDEDFSLDVGLVKAETPSVAESFAFEFSTPVADNGNVSESAVLSYSKNPSETASATDSGFILGQDYCGIDYFSDDYVGIKRTFT